MSNDDSSSSSSEEAEEESVSWSVGSSESGSSSSGSDSESTRRGAGVDVEQDEEKSEHHLRLALLYLKLGNNYITEKRYLMKNATLAMLYNKHNSLPVALLGHDYRLGLQDLMTAAAFYKKALSIHSAEMEAVDALAEICVNSGLIQGAERIYDEAILSAMTDQEVALAAKKEALKVGSNYKSRFARTASSIKLANHQRRMSKQLTGDERAMLQRSKSAKY